MSLSHFYLTADKLVEEKRKHEEKQKIEEQESIQKQVRFVWTCDWFLTIFQVFENTSLGQARTRWFCLEKT